MSSYMCGGVISESYLKTVEARNDGYGFMMAYIMPDKEFKQYEAFKKVGDNKAAEKLFKKHAWSMI